MNATPTGNRRFRLQVRFGGRRELVLQIYDIGGMIDSEWVTFWRDARVEDLTLNVDAVSYAPVH